MTPSPSRVLRILLPAVCPPVSCLPVGGLVPCDILFPSASWSARGCCHAPLRWRRLNVRSYPTRRQSWPIPLKSAPAREANTTPPAVSGADRPSPSTAMIREGGT